MSTGRHRLLDEAKLAEICALVSVGCTLQAAAQYAGCSRATLHREASRNEEFGKRLRRAELQAYIRPARTLQHAATTHWRAAAWLLERTRPEEYATTSRNAVPLETVQDLVSRCLEVIEHELSDTPENQATCLRLTAAIEGTCQELAAAARTTRTPARLRQVVSRMATQSESPESLDAAESNLRQNDAEIAK